MITEWLISLAMLVLGWVQALIPAGWVEAEIFSWVGNEYTVPVPSMFFPGWFITGLNVWFEYGVKACLIVLVVRAALFLYRLIPFV